MYANTFTRYWCLIQISYRNSSKMMHVQCYCSEFFRMWILLSFCFSKSGILRYTEHLSNQINSSILVNLSSCKNFAIMLHNAMLNGNTRNYAWIIKIICVNVLVTIRLIVRFMRIFVLLLHLHDNKNFLPTWDSIQSQNIVSFGFMFSDTGVKSFSVHWSQSVIFAKTRSNG